MYMPYLDLFEESGLTRGVYKMYRLAAFQSIKRLIVAGFIAATPARL